MTAVVLILVGLGIFFMFHPMRQPQNTAEIQRCDHQQQQEEIDYSQTETSTDNPQPVQLMRHGESHKSRRSKYKASLMQQPMPVSRKRGNRLHRFGQKHAYDLINGDEERVMKLLQKLKNAKACLDNAGLVLGNDVSPELDYYEM